MTKTRFSVYAVAAALAVVAAVAIVNASRRAEVTQSIRTGGKGGVNCRGAGLLSRAECSVLIRAEADAIIPQLHCLGVVTDVVLDGSDVTTAGIRGLSQLPDLRTIRLRRTALRGDDFRLLSTCQAVQFLDVSYTSASDRDLQLLCTNPHISTLGIAETNISADGLRHVRTNLRIRPLFVSGVQLRGPGARHIARSAVQHLHIQGAGADDGLLFEVVPVLAESRHLRRLDLSSTQISDKAVPVLSQLEFLDELYLPRQISEAAVSELRHALPDADIIKR